MGCKLPGYHLRPLVVTITSTDHVHLRPSLSCRNPDPKVDVGPGNKLGLFINQSMYLKHVCNR